MITAEQLKDIKERTEALNRYLDKLKEKSAVPPTGTHKTEQKIIR